MGVEIKLNTGLSLSPRLLLSMKILQMNAQELVDYMKRLEEENPAFELREDMSARAELSRWTRRHPWLEGAGGLCELSGERPESLLSELKRQLGALTLSAPVAAAAQLIAEGLDKDGFLPGGTESLRGAGFSEPELNAALATVRYMLDPAGVAAENTTHCLLLQLERLDERSELAERLVSSHLKLLARGDIAAVARALDCSVAEAEQACALVRTLNPRPSAGFASEEETRYVVPDCFVLNGDDGLSVRFGDAFLPTPFINEYYSNMLKSTEDAEVRDYLSEKINQAKWTIYSVGQRRRTLVGCAAYMAEFQRDFFLGGPGHMRALNMETIAANVGVNVSTVSRAIRGKHFQCAWGLFPFSALLPRSLGAASSESAREHIRRLISREDRAKPLSDEKLARALAGEGFDISRRTVAKYRAQLGIPETSVRRRRNSP